MSTIIARQVKIRTVTNLSCKESLLHESSYSLGVLSYALKMSTVSGVNISLRAQCSPPQVRWQRAGRVAFAFFFFFWGACKSKAAGGPAFEEDG